MAPSTRDALALSATVLALGLVALERRRRHVAEAEAAQQQQEAARCLKLRDEERKGRVRAEQQLREAGRGAGAGSVESPEGFSFHPIGTFQSCYRQRCGTPRQGNLVTSSLAVLRCVKDLNPNAALQGLEEFSHVWVLYVFHENTNLPKEARSASRRKQQQGRIPLWQGLCMKVAPPRCPELRVGVLACRTPHRPNPVGLSLAKVVRVDAARGELVLGGLDVVDGTPCLDIKPYLPSFESLPSANVPSWVRASYEEPLMSVSWSAAARDELAALLASSKPLRLWPFQTAEDLRIAIQDTLALDIRSPLQRERHPNPGPSAAKVPFFTGDLWFHELHIKYSLLPEPPVSDGATASVCVESIEVRPPEKDKPAGVA